MPNSEAGSHQTSDKTGAVAPVPGDLDTSFSGDGRVLTAVGEFDRSFAAGSAIQADGKIVVAGTSGNDFAVARFTSAGVLDSSFSGDGFTTTEFPPSGVGEAANVAIQPNGAIVVIGSSNNNFAVARYTSSGELDPSFHFDGRLTTNIVGSSSVDSASDVAIQQPGGEIVVGGTSDGNFAVVRYTASGNLDPTFNGDGALLTDLTRSPARSSRPLEISPATPRFGAKAATKSARARRRTSSTTQRSAPTTRLTKWPISSAAPNPSAGEPNEKRARPSGARSLLCAKSSDPRRRAGGWCGDPWPDQQDQADHDACDSERVMHEDRENDAYDYE